MKTLLAIFSGSITAAVFAFLVTWMVSGSSAVPSINAALHGGPGVSLTVTVIALILGAYVAVKIDPSLETASGYATVQLFFGPALIREFWLGDPTWYAVVAIVIVLPLTFIGAFLGGMKWKGAQVPLSE